jgi:hypothetical protein
MTTMACGPPRATPTRCPLLVVVARGAAPTGWIAAAPESRFLAAGRRAGALLRRAHKVLKCHIGTRRPARPPPVGGPRRNLPHPEPLVVRGDYAERANPVVLHRSGRTRFHHRRLGRRGDDSGGSRPSSRARVQPGRRRHHQVCLPPHAPDRVAPRWRPPRGGLPCNLWPDPSGPPPLHGPLPGRELRRDRARVVIWLNALRAYAPALLLALGFLVIVSCSGHYRPAAHLACGSSYSHPFQQARD